MLIKKCNRSLFKSLIVSVKSFQTYNKLMWMNNCCRLLKTIGNIQYLLIFIFTMIGLQLKEQINFFKYNDIAHNGTRLRQWFAFSALLSKHYVYFIFTCIFLFKKSVSVTPFQTIYSSIMQMSEEQFLLPCCINLTAIICSNTWKALGAPNLILVSEFWQDD